MINMCAVKHFIALVTGRGACKEIICDDLTLLDKTN